MLKKSVYLIQVNFRYGNTAHLPYAAGCLEAYAKSNKYINSEYFFEDIIFLREDIDKVLSGINNPFIVAFSSYIWNFEYNKTLAQKVKQKYPECIIIFGGHHVPYNAEILVQNPFIDYLIHGEGEVPFCELLLNIAQNKKVDNIAGISYRQGEKCLTNPCVIANHSDFPSPYISGAFDNIIKKYPDMNFMGLIETSRGCPYGCSFCDWSSENSVLRKFPIERVIEEIEWIKDNKILGLGGADANFGIFERDEAITDLIISAKKETGYPEAFQTSYAKNSNSRVFRIGKKLEEAKMNKGITLSFQSMNKEVLNNIGRENISVESYRQLMNMYNEDGIATYTELIIGLPGETKKSFENALETLLELGQHTCIYVHDCEFLPCSGMSKEEYKNKYKITTSRIPLNQPHRGKNFGDGIEEYSNIVTENISMSKSDWTEMNLISIAVQCFHHMSLLKFVAIFLYSECGVKYIDFYRSFLSFALKNKQSVCGRAFVEIEKKLSSVADGNNESLVYYNEVFGDVLWSGEEYVNLKCVYEKEKFYSEIYDFLMSFCPDKEIMNELIRFQKDMIRKPDDKDNVFTYSYDFISFFKGFLKNEKPSLIKKETVFNAVSDGISSWQEYAKFTVWFGRRDSRNLYLFNSNVNNKKD